MNASKELAITAAFAMGALGLAAKATQPTVTAPRGSQVIVSCDEVTEVELRGPDRAVRLSQNDDAITVELAAGGETRRFRGGEQAEAYLERLSPFRSERTLGELEPERLEAAELDAPRVQWTLTCDGEAHVFDVGAIAFGSGERYFRSQEGGPVHLVLASVVRDLETAETHLKEHRIFRFEPQEAAAATITAPQQLRISHRNRRSHDAAWVAEHAPNERRVDLDRLLRAVFQLSVRSESAAPPEDAERIVEMEFEDAQGDTLGRLELWRGGAGPEITYYARGEDWVTVLPSAGSAVARTVGYLEP
ncbi:MAG: DUF4340 domain-containing protein [Myxococcota bacterium]